MKKIISYFSFVTFVSFVVKLELQAHGADRTRKVRFPGSPRDSQPHSVENKELISVDNQEVKQTVLAILAGVMKKPGLDFSERTDLSSIQILNTLSQVEKQFQVEIEDEYVFHGLFSSAEVLTSYINYKLQLSSNDDWRCAIDT